MGVHEGENERSLDRCEKNIEQDEESYANGLAEIPELRLTAADFEKEYENFPEERLWCPQEEIGDWLPLYIFMARSVLTFVQERKGVPNREAMENSCTGSAEQYISDVLHSCRYVPEVAVKTLLTKPPPKKLLERWTPSDIELFVEGLALHGKNFTSIRKSLLPEKETGDLVDFYYAWKWSRPVMKLRGIRWRRQIRTKRRFSSINSIFRGVAVSKIIARGASTTCENLNVQEDRIVSGDTRRTNVPRNSVFLSRRRSRVSSHGSSKVSSSRMY